MLRSALYALLALAVPLAPRVAEAATYDPQLTWRTLVTDRLRIHFHQGEEQLAAELAETVDEVWPEITGELAWRPRMKVDVVLIDRTDRANGFASAIPYNSITIFVTAPQEDSTLGLYEDWTDAIFTHELTHVVHMEANGGIVSLARAIVGRIASSNAVSPSWLVEGLATFQETRHTPGGRGRSPYVDMIKRAAHVDDAFPPLGNLDGYQAALPSGNLRYLFGQDFMQFVADEQGENVWTRWVHTYGRSIPFLIPAKKVFGRSLQSLYRDWKHAFAERYERQLGRVAAEGLREGRRISDPAASCTAPSFAPDDSRMVWSCYDPRTGNALWTAEIDGSGATKLKQDFGAKSFTWRADSKALVFASTHLVNRFNVWSDIYLFDVASQKVRALSSGARARDPDFSPDGRELLVVTNRVPGHRAPGDDGRPADDGPHHLHEPHPVRHPEAQPRRPGDRGERVGGRPPRPVAPRPRREPHPDGSRPTPPTTATRAGRVTAGGSTSRRIGAGSRTSTRSRSAPSASSR